eukprot:COSAG01_NODE_58082_length_308_cov_0.803828_1_plen_28_part_01
MTAKNLGKIPGSMESNGWIDATVASGCR